MRTVAVDAMGGDRAPMPEVEGAVRAAASGVARVVLVGDERVEAAVRALSDGVALLGDGRLRLQKTSQVITMDDHPSQAARKKKDSSMRVAFELAARGDADAVVSAGNSGAMLALGLFVLKRLPGVDRPGIVTALPTTTGVCALIDMGANVDVKPATLAQFAALGAAYSRVAHRRSRPRVGLLSNGEEAHKGTELTRAAHQLLASAPSSDFEYVGPVEGKDIFGGEVDVVVTDGFTGNVVLKTAEGAGQLLLTLLRREIEATPIGKVGALFLRGAFRRLRRAVDWDEEGGAPLVGVDGVAVICHGRSNAKAIQNAIRVATELADAGLVTAVGRTLERNAALWAGLEVAEA